MEVGMAKIENSLEVLFNNEEGNVDESISRSLMCDLCEYCVKLLIRHA